MSVHWTVWWASASQEIGRSRHFIIYRGILKLIQWTLVEPSHLMQCHHEKFPNHCCGNVLFLFLVFSHLHLKRRVFRKLDSPPHSPHRRSTGFELASQWRLLSAGNTCSLCGIYHWQATAYDHNLKDNINTSRFILSCRIYSTRLQPYFPGPKSTLSTH